MADGAASRRLQRCNPDRRENRECDGRRQGTGAARIDCIARWPNSWGGNYRSLLGFTCRVSVLLPPARCLLLTAFCAFRAIPDGRASAPPRCLNRPPATAGGTDCLLFLLPSAYCNLPTVLRAIPDGRASAPPRCLNRPPATASDTDKAFCFLPSAFCLLSSSAYRSWAYSASCPASPAEHCFDSMYSDFGSHWFLFLSLHRHS